MDPRSTSEPDRARRGPHLDDHLCLDLVQDLLAPAERRKHLAHLAECPACEERFREWAVWAERFEATRILRVGPDGEIVAERRDVAEQASDDRGRRRWGILLRIWPALQGVLTQRRYQLAGGLALAAAILILILGPQHTGSPGNPDLRMLPAYSFLLQARDYPQAIPNKELRAGLEAYRHKDFKGATRLLEKARDPERGKAHEMIRSIYLASALAWRGRHRDAARLLDEVAPHLVPGEWGLETQWTLYVALRESGQRARADSLLQITAELPGEIGARASRLLEREE